MKVKVANIKEAFGDSAVHEIDASAYTEWKVAKEAGKYAPKVALKEASRALQEIAEICSEHFGSGEKDLFEAERRRMVDNKADPAHLKVQYTMHCMMHYTLY
jgi:hypothetical protein